MSTPMAWPLRPDTASRQQQVHARAAGVVEDSFARMDRPDAQRIADAGEARRACIGQQRELVGVVPKVVGRVARATVKVKIATGVARDTVVGRKDLCAQPGNVESDGACCCHDWVLLVDRRADQAMIGASAAPIRCPCAGVIIPFSNSPNRGICTPETMYCQRYAARTVAFTASTSTAVMGRPQISTK